MYQYALIFNCTMPV